MINPIIKGEIARPMLVTAWTNPIAIPLTDTGMTTNNAPQIDEINTEYPNPLMNSGMSPI